MQCYLRYYVKLYFFQYTCAWVCYIAFYIPLEWVESDTSCLILVLSYLTLYTQIEGQSAILLVVIFFYFEVLFFFFNNINENYLLAMNFIQCVWIVLVYPKSFSIFLAPVIKLRSQYPYFIFTALHFSYNV